MRLLTEFTIISEDSKMPEGSFFCSEIWKSDSFDSDGDFYWDYPDEKWTFMNLKGLKDENIISCLDLWIYRDDKKPTTGVFEAHDLKRFLEYKREGRYNYNEKINRIKSTMITTFVFETIDIKHYNNFLDTVYKYLLYTDGILLNYGEKQSDSFFDHFLKDSTM